MSRVLYISSIQYLDGGGISETKVPEVLPSGELIILQPIGSLFFAGVAEIEEKLPAVGRAWGTVVIFHMRDRDEVGSTFLRTIKQYTLSLQEKGNKLMLERIKLGALE